ncbi:hypothetical protein EMPS_05283 [Entomortierella parvispora]|uniref:Uncharacterized protein n=1 Tax=Entomortierella parvispora TaxID=205924 RepID=A0A9P3LWL1_9FUNG|nr:hypothetical protein EMPS_05283 [Entomortierella parvispora]
MTVPIPPLSQPQPKLPHGHVFGGAYPLLGIVYLVQHIRQLGPQFIRSLLSAFLVTLLILLPLAALTFKYQRRLILCFVKIVYTATSFLYPTTRELTLLGFSIPTWSALILTMGETSVLVALVMGEVFKKEKSKGLFKKVLALNQLQIGPLATLSRTIQTSNGAVLKQIDYRDSESNDSKLLVTGESHIQVVSTEAMVSREEARRRKRDLVKAASFQVGERILLWCLTLPLNLLPVAGQVTFCYINGKARMPDIHRYYFDKKEMTEKEREDWIKRQEAQYLAFGFVSQALELVPIFGILFGFTNSIGAALWAVELERKQDVLRNRKLLKDMPLGLIEK